MPLWLGVHSGLLLARFLRAPLQVAAITALRPRFSLLRETSPVTTTELCITFPGHFPGPAENFPAWGNFPVHWGLVCLPRWTSPSGRRVCLFDYLPHTWEVLAPGKAEGLNQGLSPGTQDGGRPLVRGGPWWGRPGRRASLCF